MPPVGVRLAVLNRGRKASLSCHSGEVGREKFEMDVAAGGHRVSSVLEVTEWNLAKEMILEAWLGPEWRMISGRAVPRSDIGSFWMVM